MRRTIVQPDLLSPETLSRIRVLALEQLSLMDELEAALQSDDQPRVMELARQIVNLEKEVERQ
jgi:hypothetical protein